MPLSQLAVANSSASLAAALDLVADLDVVGVDVERADWDRYYRAAALVQVGGDGRVAVVDPLSVQDLSPLDDFLVDRVAVLHAMENDLDPLASAGVRPPRVEDTAVAAALLGLSTGLEGLLAEALGVTLDGDKAAMQRADWEARPLPEEMIRYAAGDVADLPALWAALDARLGEQGRRNWYRETVATLLAQPSIEQRRAWTRTKGAGRLEPAARGRLRALWEERESLGRRTNTAPGRIAADAVLVGLATDPPGSRAELGRRGLRRQAVRDFGDALLAAAAAAEPEPSPTRHARPLSDADRAIAERLRQLRAARAAELGIDPGVLCPSRTLLAAVMADPATPESLRDALGLQRWQWAEVGPAFCEALGLPPPGNAAADAADEETRDG